MTENYDKKEKMLENTPKLNKESNKEYYLNRRFRLITFILFISLIFILNIEAIGLLSKELKYQTYVLKLATFFILCLFPTLRYDKMKSIFVLFSTLFLFYFNVMFIEIPPNFLSSVLFFSRIYSLVYLRIWIEQFSMIRYKTLFMFILNIFALTGDKFSIAINIYIKFKYNMVLILTLHFFVFVGLLFMPNEYFHIHNRFYHYHKEATKNEKKVDENNEMKKIDKENDYSKEVKKNEEKVKEKIQCIKNEKESETEIESDKISVFMDVEKQEKENKKDKYKYIFQIFRNSCYIWSILGKASIYYLFTLLDYSLKDLENFTPEKMNSFFRRYEIIISFFSILGSCIGGLLSFLIGGYDDIKSCIIVSISITLSLLSTFSLSYSSSSSSIIYLSLFTLYISINISSGYLEGYIIKSIPLKYKEFGLNFCGLISTLGCLLAENMYTYIKYTFEKTNHIYAWKFCLACFLFGYFSLLLSCTFRYRDINKMKERLKKENDYTVEMSENNDIISEDRSMSHSYSDYIDDEIEYTNLRNNLRKTSFTS